MCLEDKSLWSSAAFSGFLGPDKSDQKTRQGAGLVGNKSHLRDEHLLCNIILGDVK